MPPIRLSFKRFPRQLYKKIEYSPQENSNAGGLPSNTTVHETAPQDPPKPEANSNSSATPTRRTIEPNLKAFDSDSESEKCETPRAIETSPGSPENSVDFGRPPTAPPRSLSLPNGCSDIAKVGSGSALMAGDTMGFCVDGLLPSERNKYVVPDGRHTDEVEQATEAGFIKQDIPMWSFLVVYDYQLEFFFPSNILRRNRQRSDDRQEEMRKLAQQLLEDARRQSRTETPPRTMSTSVSDEQLTEVITRLPTQLIPRYYGELPATIGHYLLKVEGRSHKVESAA